MARSIANSLAVVLIDRVPRVAARASAPTWSTPGRPWRNRRSEASERVISEKSQTGGARCPGCRRSSGGGTHPASIGWRRPVDRKRGGAAGWPRKWSSRFRPTSGRITGSAGRAAGGRRGRRSGCGRATRASRRTSRGGPLFVGRAGLGGDAAAAAVGDRVATSSCATCSARSRSRWRPSSRSRCGRCARCARATVATCLPAVGKSMRPSSGATATAKDRRSRPPTSRTPSSWRTGSATWPRRHASRPGSA